MNAYQKKVKQIIDDLPSKIDWDDFQYRIYVMAKIDRSRESAKEGLIEQGEMEREFVQ